MDLRATIAYLSVASLLTAAAAGRTRAQEYIPASQVIGTSIPHFLATTAAERDSVKRRLACERFARKAERYGRALVEDTTVCFYYTGRASRVGVPGDLNGWNPAADTMTRIRGTNFFYLLKTAPRKSRFEYKLAVDSTWILDPSNHQQVFGGFGPNSEVWMPGYRPPPEILHRPGVPSGSLDTLAVTSTVLGRTYPVIVYRPFGYDTSRSRYPTLYVTDGGEFLSLGLMNTILDNMIAGRHIRPIVGVFVDPRTDIRKQSSSKRMTDYAMSDSFVTFLTHELRPLLAAKYRLSDSAKHTAIMGSSLGALISTYAAYTHPEVFGMCAAQSPAYWWKDRAMIRMIDTGSIKPVRFYLDTGTINDAQDNARLMRDTLERKGYTLHYAEFPEGHNWANWRARIPAILGYFWGTQ